LLSGAGQGDPLFHGKKWSIVPDVQHTVCLIDALARSNHLEQAENIILNKVPDILIAWTTLLGACRSYNYIERAIRVADIIKKLDNGVQYLVF
jgi:hypothetical protein